MRLWSSSAAFSGARDPANSVARRAASNSRRQRLVAEAREAADGLRAPSLRDEIHEAEAARIVVGDALAVIEMQARRGRASGPSSARDGKRRASSVSRPRCGTSPTCRDARSASRRCRAANRRYLARRASATIRRPVSRSAKRGREGKAHVGAAQLDLLDARADHRRLQAAPDRLDLRQFRHRRCSRMTARNAAPYFCSLTAPTPCRPASSSSVSRPRLRHFDQRAVGKDDIGRLVLRRARSRRAAPSARRAASASASRGSARRACRVAAPSR